MGISCENGEILLYNVVSNELKRSLNKTDQTVQKVEANIESPVLAWSQEFLFYVNNSWLIVYDYLKNSEIIRKKINLGTLGLITDIVIAEHSMDSGVILITSEYQAINYSIKNSKRIFVNFRSQFEHHKSV